MLGIVGGTGLYRLEGLEDRQSDRIPTPFGDPSSPITTGRLGNLSVAFLARHGERHELLPGEINYRANLWALKSIGVTEIVSVSAVGSLEKGLAPGSIVLPDQFLDLTKGLRRHILRRRHGGARFDGLPDVPKHATANSGCRRRVRASKRTQGRHMPASRVLVWVRSPRAECSAR